MPMLLLLLLLLLLLMAITKYINFATAAIQLPTTARALTLINNSSGCIRSCNVAVHDNHGNGTSPNFFTTYYSKAVYDFITKQPPGASSSRH
jgi:hypothetical protein